MRILLFIGTRPEGIKLAPVVTVLRARPKDFTVSVCLISQHKQLLTQGLRWFPEVKADTDMAIMRDNQGLADVAAAALQGAQKAIADFRPDVIIVQGDTTTALSCALAGFYADVTVAHVEAGLRSHNRHSPWPEEMNRVLISRLATIHFAPNENNAKNLQSEKASGDIHVVGNTVIDALLLMRRRINEDTAVSGEIMTMLDDAGYMPRKERDFILVTGHRRESFGEGLQNICRALLQIAAEQPQLDIVYVLHLNPKARDTVCRLLKNQPNVFLLPPVDYGAFVHLMDCCYLLMSDSGGVQEEAPSLNKPLLVMRNATERPEVADCGAAMLCSTATADIVTATRKVLSDRALYDNMAAAANPYGDGKSAARIADILATERR